MNRKKNRYIHFSSKWILAAFYFFLLSLQFNGRFFSISSYYVFHPKTAATVSDHNANFLSKQNGQTGKDVHLSLDKRFHNKRLLPEDLATIPFDQALAVPAPIQLKKKVCTFPRPFVKIYTCTSSLRGPPRVMSLS